MVPRFALSSSIGGACARVSSPIYRKIHILFFHFFLEVDCNTITKRTELIIKRLGHGSCLNHAKSSIVNERKSYAGGIWKIVTELEDGTIDLWWTTSDDGISSQRLPDLPSLSSWLLWL
jgi:hypothetical protein